MDRETAAALEKLLGRELGNEEEGAPATDPGYTAYWPK